MAPPPITEKEEGGEGWGSRLRRRRTPAGCLTPPAATTRVGTTHQSKSTRPSQREKGKGSNTSKGQKRARLTSGEDAEAAAAASASPPRARLTSGEDAEAAAAASASPPRARLTSGEDAEAVAAVSTSPPPGNATSSGSVVSSPLRWPELPRAVLGKTAFGEEILEPFHQINPAIVRAHDKLVNRYTAKQDRQLKLLSLDQRIPRSCMLNAKLLSVRESAEKSILKVAKVVVDRQLKLLSLDQRIPRSCMLNAKLLSVRESAEKSILKVAKVVVGLSSYIEGKLLRRASGFLIDWDAKDKSGTVLTSALVIQSKSPSLDQWLATDEYSPHAEVRVHLMDKADTTIVAKLLHYDKNYNLALFKISKDLKAQMPSFTNDLKFAEEVFVLGRDEGRNLTIDHGKVAYKGPSQLHRHHYMFITCGINKLAIGGPVIKDGGKIAGMYSLPEMAFIPSSIILKCLEMWKNVDCIPRLHVGMKFSAISFLDLPHREKIACKRDINDGLIVTQVSEGSVAEKVGVRRGDIIKSWNGENISTTIELENFLLDMCKKHLDKGYNIGSPVDLSIGIFYIRKDSHDTIQMSVNVSDGIEVVVEGIYPVTAKDCTMVDDYVDDGLTYGEAPSDDEDDDIESSCV